jgi:selenocysteine-specific elongation factor
MILATAGHVDHGKTTLVRALTGIDTDRLPEEKRRGMTIEPGFAHARWGSGASVSLVDVPGHVGFLRQAICGLAGVDAALLVVACDDGPMPQTCDHLALLHLLGVQRGVLVLTKADRAPPARVVAVAQEVRLLLRDTALAQMPECVVSAQTGQGMDGLRQVLASLAQAAPVPRGGAHFRLAVDRVFTRSGAGTVVTGTVLSGQVCRGEVVCHGVTGDPLRVRTVHSQGQEVEMAVAGQRCALALVSSGKTPLERGSWVLAPALFAPTRRVDAQLQWLATAPRALDGGQTMQLHMGTACGPVRVLPLQPRQLEPGDTGLVQLLTRAPFSALHGDRFVLYDPACQALMGGGIVLDAAAPTRGRASGAHVQVLEALCTPNWAQALDALTHLQPGGLQELDVLRQWNRSMAELCDLQADAAWQTVHTRSGRRLVARAHWQVRVQAVALALQDWHAREPGSPGLPDAALVRALQTRGAGLSDAAAEKDLCRAAIAAAIDHALVQRDGFVLRCPGHRARIDAVGQAMIDRVRVALQPRQGLRPAPWGDLAVLLGMPLAEAQAVLEQLAAQGHVVQVAKNRFFLPETVQVLMDVARACAAAASDHCFEAASFRDQSGVGRNLSIQLLEYFDRIGHTRYRAGRRSVVAQ